MEIRPNRKNERQFFPGSGRFDTAVWMHHLDANKTAREEARRQLHKTVTATCLPSRKRSELDEPDTQDTAGEAETSS